MNFMKCDYCHKTIKKSDNYAVYVYKDAKGISSLKYFHISNNSLNKLDDCASRFKLVGSVKKK